MRRQSRWMFAPRPLFMLTAVLCAITALSAPWANATETALKAEAALGDRMAALLFERRGMPLESEPLRRYVNRTAAAVARHAAPPDMPLYAVVIADPAPGAWAIPGGILAISAGLMARMEDESELAGMMAHLLARLAGRHLLRTYATAYYESPAANLDEMIERMGTLLLEKAPPEDRIRSADASALAAAHRAGYDPGGLPRLVARLAAGEDSGNMGINPERVAALRGLMAQYPNAEGRARARERFQTHRMMLDSR